MLGFLISVIVNKYYGKESYGSLVLVFIVTSLFFSFCSLGSISTLNRFLPQYVKSGSDRLISGMLVSAIIIQGAGIVISCAAIFFFADWIAAVFFRKPQVGFMLKIGVVYFLGLSMTNYIFGLFQSLQSWFKEAVLQAIYLALYLAFICVSIFFLKTGIESVLYSNLLAAVVTVCAGIFLLPKDLFRNILKLNSISDLKDGFKKTISFGLPLLLVNLNFYFLMWVDKILLGRYITSSDLALYYIGFIFYGAIALLLKSLYTVFMPYIAEFSPHDGDLIGKKFRIISKGFLYITILLSIITFFWIEPVIILMYGKSYGSSVAIFRFFLAVFLIRGLFTPASMFTVNVFNEAKRAAFASTLLVVLCVAFEIIFIPHLGYNGAILANILAYLIYSALYFVLFEKIREIFPYKTFAKSLGILSLLAIAYYLCAPFLPDNQFMACAMGIFMAAAYIGMLVITKGISAGDIAIGKEVLLSLKSGKIFTPRSDGDAA